MMAPRHDGAERGFRFGPYQLLPGRQRLMRGSTPVALGARAFDILTALVEHAGDVVTRDALVGRAWPRTIVGAGSLKVHIAALRKAFKTVPGGAGYIETVPGRGYRFLADVEVIQGPDLTRTGDGMANPVSFREGGELVHQFGEFRFVPGRGVLMRGKARLRVGARALDLLLALIERAGTVVSKEELMRLAWPRAHVHEANLKVNIGALRRALAGASGALPTIVTVPGRGYRFAAPVQSDIVGLAPPVSFSLPATRGVFGRDTPVREIVGQLTASRFVTITGPAGVGKTTVAVEVARSDGAWPDGACFVDLAVVDDTQLITAAIAAALGVVAGMSNLLLGIEEALRGRSVLLVLDNCEHLRSAVAAIVEHLHTTLSTLTLLATSREPLHASAEVVYRLSPLSVPDPAETLGASAAGEFAAIQLFVQRAGEAYPFVLTDDNASVVAAICQRLDGIALAIELAAAQLGRFTLPALLDRLGASLEPLARVRGAGPPRQQTLVATLDWSYRLLPPDEAVLLRWMSVFAGSFTLDDLIAVCGSLGHPPPVVASLVASLSAKSLLAAGWQAGGMDYRLLDTMRRYAAGRLADAGEESGARAAHAEAMLKVIIQAEGEWRWRPGQGWTRMYARRANDLRKAIEWSFGEGGQPLTGMRLTAAAIPLWDELSSVAESRRRIDTALFHMEGMQQREPLLAMKLVAARAWGLMFAERLELYAEEVWQQSYALAVAAMSIDYQLRALWGLAVFQTFTGRHRDALATLERFRHLAVDEDELASLPDGERLRCTTAFYCGDISNARAGLVRLARAAEADAERSRLARFQVDRAVGVQVSLAVISWVMGDANAAEQHVHQALSRAAALDHVVSYANALAQAGLPVMLWNGHLTAVEQYVEALTESLNQRGLGIWGPVSRFYRGAVASARGDARGVLVMEAAIAELVASHFVVRVPMYCAMLADAALTHGQLEVARTAISHAIRLSEAQDERWCEGEILRVQALLSWANADAETARHLFALAIERSTASSALAFARKAVMNLDQLPA